MTNIASKLDMTNPNHALGALMPEGANDYCPTLIKRSIAAVGATGKKLDARIHAVAYALVLRSLPMSDTAAVSGSMDCSMVHTLLNSMPRSGRTKALVAWFKAFSNISIRTNKDGTYATCNMVGHQTDAYRLITPDMLAAAWAKPFYSVEEKDTDPKAFDDKAFENAIKALIKRATDDNAKLSPEAAAMLADIQSAAKGVLTKA